MGYVKRVKMRVSADGKTAVRLGPPTLHNVKGKGNKRLTNQITRVLNRKLETKYVAEGIRNTGGGVQLDTYVGFNGSIGGVGEIYSMIPLVKQGSGDHQRIGGKIVPSKIRTQMSFTYVSQAIQSTYAKDIIVDVFMLTCKNVKQEGNYTAVPIIQLLNSGDGLTADYDGTEQNALMPVHTPLFTVLKRYSFRLSKGQGDINSAAGGVYTPSKSYHRITHTLSKKHCPALKYSLDADEFPSNYFPFLCVGFRFADGTTVPSSTALLQVQGRADMWFKDA